MSKSDKLLEGAVRAIKGTGGSYKTQYNHIQEATRFVEQLRDLGYGVQRWNNLSLRHVGEVVDSWKERGLAPATIKEYMSGVRTCARFFGNDRVANSNNARFGIENRTYISNQNKATPAELYQQAVDRLKSSMDIRDHAVAAQLQLQRELGLRVEESTKFSPARDILKDGRAHISAGTKGGRERMLPSEVVQSPGAQTAIKYADQVRAELGNKRNTIPSTMSERQYRNYYSKAVSGAGLTRANGGTSHGNRHAWAQDRYRSLTGFNARVEFKTREEFVAAATSVAGPEWAKIDQDARLQIKSELGHGPDRDDVVSQYLGSGSS